MNPIEELLIAPKVTPVLDPWFRPAVLAHRAFQKLAQNTPDAPTVELLLEQADGSRFPFKLKILPTSHRFQTMNLFFVERFIKFLLWSYGGFRIYWKGPSKLAVDLQAHYRTTVTGQFDSEVIGQKVYDHEIEIIVSQELPRPKSTSAPLGRHLEGCRIGFDLGGSDRKVAAVIDGQVVFSEEIVWDPIPQSNPQYHYDGIMDSLKRAAAHLPRIDAIGGSAAGIYVNNQVKVASLFRNISSNDFETRIRNIFSDLKRAWNNVPFEVVNDGEVTALAGSMSLKQNAILGIALGTNTAGGYVTRDGNITTWLNELSFTPNDYHPNAPVDEWSHDHGCGALFFSQRAVGRLLPAAGIFLPDDLPLPEKLVAVQELMKQNDYRAEKIFQTIGTYLGYATAQYSDFYDLDHVLLLGRVTSGQGGEIMIQEARKTLQIEFPELAEQIQYHLPDEKEKRHGQAIAAASLPFIG